MPNKKRRPKCPVCSKRAGKLFTPEEYDATAPPTQAPLRSMTLLLDQGYLITRLCNTCIQRTIKSYEFCKNLTVERTPSLDVSIHTIRQDLQELSLELGVIAVEQDICNDPAHDREGQAGKKEAPAAEPTSTRNPECAQSESAAAVNATPEGTDVTTSDMNNVEPCD